MFKDSSYQEKFVVLKKWLPLILDSIKKDLRNEHLKKDWRFVKNYFSGKNLNKLTSEDLAQAYGDAVASTSNGEELAEFISNRWLLKNSELYHFFEEELTKVNPNFSEIEALDTQVSLILMEEAIKKFGAPGTYLFSVFNSVVFPTEVYEELAKRAEKQIDDHEKEEEQRQEQLSYASMQQNYEQQIARMTDKYEKKLLGMQKKYSQDVESLKKQIAALQRKVSA